MDESLLAAFRATRYLVCLDPVEWADIRIDQPLLASFCRGPELPEVLPLLR